MKTTEEYSKKNKDKWKNITEEEKEGLKSILTRRKEREIVTNITDKSGRFSVDTIENYIVLNDSLKSALTKLMAKKTKLSTKKTEKK